MSVQLGLISDIHAAADPLREALAIFARKRVDLVLCAGDIAGYGTELEQSVGLLTESGCRTVCGNHDVRLNGQGPEVRSFLRNLPQTWEATIKGKRIFMVHASPPCSMNRGITLLDQYEQMLPEAKERWTRELAGYPFDVLIVGHTHQVFAEMLGRVLVINPGSTVFNHTCAILSLPDPDVQIVPLSGKKPRRVWHWGMMTH